MKLGICGKLTAFALRQPYCSGSGGARKAEQAVALEGSALRSWAMYLLKAALLDRDGLRKVIHRAVCGAMT